MLGPTLKGGFAERIFITELSWKIRVILENRDMLVKTEIYGSIRDILENPS